MARKDRAGRLRPARARRRRPRSDWSRKWESRQCCRARRRSRRLRCRRTRASTCFRSPPRTLPPTSCLSPSGTRRAPAQARSQLSVGHLRFGTAARGGRHGLDHSRRFGPVSRWCARAGRRGRCSASSWSVSRSENLLGFFLNDGRPPAHARRYYQLELLRRGAVVSLVAMEEALSSRARAFPPSRRCRTRSRIRSARSRAIGGRCSRSSASARSRAWRCGGSLRAATSPPPR